MPLSYIKIILESKVAKLDRDFFFMSILDLRKTPSKVLLEVVGRSPSKGKIYKANITISLNGSYQ